MAKVAERTAGYPDPLTEGRWLGSAALAQKDVSELEWACEHLARLIGEVAHD